MPFKGDPSKVPPPKSGSTEAYNLLSLDGGGVKGISSMIVLKKIMDRVRELENENRALNNVPINPEERRPVDYFDLAAGTIPDSVQYLFIKLGGFGKFAGGAVLKARAITGRAQFSHKRLEKAIDTVVAAFPLDEDDQAKRGDAVLVKKSQGQMFVCATLADKGESILLRNYDPPFALLPVSTGAKDLDFDAITIKEAARATSAAPTYLKEVTVQNLKFWDGGLLNNNPINQVWDNRFDLIPSLDASPRITCIVSLGTTHKDYDLVGRRPGSGIARLFNTLSKTASFLTNTEAKHRDFDRNVRQHNMRVPRRQTGYYRFNAPTGKESIGLDDYWKMPKLVEYTNVYLEMPVVDAWINECASLLAKQQL